METFRSLLTRALLPGEPDTPLVWLGNFECEAGWRRPDAVRLPGAGLSASPGLVGHMGELALCLAGPKDLVVLKAPPDPNYLRYLADLGLSPAGQIICDSPEPDITGAALSGPSALARLRRAAADGYRLLPYGCTRREEELAAAAGLPLMAVSAAVCEQVNSKVYSRRLGARLGVRTVPGAECTTADELRQAAADLAPLLARGHSLVLKDAMGVSGKGLVVIESQRKLDLLVQSMLRALERTPHAALSFVLEQWLDKRADFNYQFVVGRDGQVHFCFIKEAIVQAGVHSGHRFPHTLGPQADAAIREAAELLGRALAADGYAGVAGVDGIVTQTGEVYPNLEINARFNMSTYQSRLTEELLDSRRPAMARHYNLRLRRPVAFAEMRRLLAGQLLQPGGVGLFIQCWATVNAGFAAGGPATGRLYTIISGADPSDLAAREERLAATLQQLEEG